MSDTAKIRRVFLAPEQVIQLDRFADANGMSRSEALREAMRSFTVNDYPPRTPTLVPISIWIDPEEYAAFAKKARESEVTIRRALDIAVEERLR